MIDTGRVEGLMSSNLPIHLKIQYRGSALPIFQPELPLPMSHDQVDTVP